LKENIFCSNMPKTNLFANMTVKEIERAMHGSPPLPLAAGAVARLSQDAAKELSEDPDWDRKPAAQVVVGTGKPRRVRRDLTVMVCWVLLSLLGFPDTVPTHDGEGNQLTPEEYKDLAIEMERMYQKCKGNPHTKEAGRAIPEAI
jgi:hypothetical protein